MSCQRAIGVAKEMQELFADRLEVEILSVESVEARKYNFKAATNVLFNGQKVPLKVAMNREAMVNFLEQSLD